jgi:hypothetical protein
MPTVVLGMIEPDEKGFSMDVAVTITKSSLAPGEGFSAADGLGSTLRLA